MPGDRSLGVALRLFLKRESRQALLSKGHGAKYVLYDGKQTYMLSDQKTPEQYAARKVIVNGTLDAKTKTIQVDRIAAAK